MRVLFTPPRFGFVSGSSGYQKRGGLPLAHIETLAGLAEEDAFVTPNSGNVIHVEAPAKILDCDRRRSATGTVPRYFGEGNDDRANAELTDNFDLVVLSFANILHHVDRLRDASMKKLENGFRLTRMFLENSQIRVAAFGIGLQEDMEASPDSLGPELYRMLQVMNDRCDIIGTRGERSADFLHRLGMNRVLPLGCPSVIVNPEGVLNPSLPRTVDNFRVGTGGRLSKIGALGDRLQPLLDMSQDYETEYVFQNDLYDLFRNNEQMAETAYNSETGEVNAKACRRAMHRAGIPSANFRRFFYFREAPAWRGWAAAHDLYLGDRFHGGVAFLQAGRPAGFLHDDLRVSELTEHYGLPSFSMDEARKRGMHDLVEEILDPTTRDRVRRVYSGRLHDFRAACAAAGIPLRESASVVNRTAADTAELAPGNSVTEAAGA